MRMAPGALCLGFFFLAAACSSGEPTVAPSEISQPPASRGASIRVLMLTATAGFRHDSIATARQVMTTLATSTGEFTLSVTEDLSAISSSNLAGYDVIAFVLTSGELDLSNAQKTALTEFVSGGRGFIGIHSASDTLYDWADYGRLVGAYFKEHPWTQPAAVIVENTTHPATSGLGERFSLLEEFYTFRDNPRGRVQVLLRLDAISVGSTGDYPLAWAQSFGTGRAYYNALGHFSETWTDQRFQRQLLGAIRWAANRD
jgi:type 1 glutamine amidotransferase